MRRLKWAGRDGKVLDPVELTIVAEAVPGPREADDLERLVEAGAILGNGHAKTVELRRDRTSSDAEFQAPTRQDIGRRSLLRAVERVMKRQQRHGRPDPD